MKQLPIVSFCLILFLSVISACSSYSSKKDGQVQQDSIAQALQDSIEQARNDSIRQDSLIKDSIAFYEFTSPDLDLFNLKGHVKEVQGSGSPHPCLLPFDGYYVTEFSYEGKILRSTCVNNPSRNGEGYIISYSFHDDGRSDGANIEWKDNNRIGQSTIIYTDYTNFKVICDAVWRVNTIVAYTQKNIDSDGVIYRETTGEIEYTSYDDYGNWTTCKIKETTDYPNGVKDYYGNRTPKESTTSSGTFERKITYYSRSNYDAEEKVAKQDVDSYQKRREFELEKKKIPDWMQGIWHLDIDGPNGVAVSNYVITIKGDNATLIDGRIEKYSGPCYVEDGFLYLGTYKRYKINGQSLTFMGHKLTKEGETSSFNGTFRTDSDVMRYLTDRTFYSTNHRMAFTYNSVTIDGRAVSGAPRISNFNSNSATIQVSPLGGGRSVYLYLNASNGTINYDGDIFRVR